MYVGILASLICTLFEEKCGDNQARKPLEERKGFTLTLSLNTRWDEATDTRVEEGYRYADLVIYGAYNAISVFVRERSHIAPCDEDGNICGDYVDFKGEWKLTCHHDSCWREAVRDYFYKYKDSAAVLGHSDFPDGYFKDYEVYHRDVFRKAGIETPMEDDDWERKRERIA